MQAPVQIVQPGCPQKFPRYAQIPQIPVRQVYCEPEEAGFPNHCAAGARNLTAVKIVRSWLTAAC